MKRPQNEKMDQPTWFQVEGGRRLIRHAPVYLNPYSEGDTVRFQRVFRATWKRLPRWFTGPILRYWRELCPCGGPNIEMAEDWPGRTEGNSGDAAAQCSLQGGELRFRVSSADSVTDQELSACIAHELTHVWLWAKGKGADQMEYPAWAENEVDDMLRELGFWDSES